MHTAKHIEIDEEPKRGRGWLIALAVVVVAAALGFGGYLFWLQRDVVVYLNGEPVEIRFRSTFADICDKAGVVPEAGDLYSITDQPAYERLGEYLIDTLHDPNYHSRDIGGHLTWKGRILTRSKNEL